jgi:hypothetical protein
MAGKLISLDVARMTKQRAYNLAPEYERALAYLCATVPRVFDRIGRLIEVDALGQDICKLAIRAAQAVAIETKEAPRNMLEVVQQVAMWRDAGKVTQQEIEQLSDLLDQGDDKHLEKDAETLIKVVVPVLRQRAWRDALMKGFDAWGQGRAHILPTLAREFSRIEGIGVNSLSSGVVMGPGCQERVRDLFALERMPLGIDELDFVLNGGLPVGAVGWIVGDTGEGKSMMLSHIAANQVWQGGFVCYATLELPAPYVEMRAIGNLTGLSLDLLERCDGETWNKAIARLDSVFSFGGALHIEHFEIRATTFAEIEQWVELCEQETGRECGLLIVDYADLLSSAEKNSLYELGLQVAEQMVKWVETPGKLRRLWTASQSSRKDPHSRGLKKKVKGCSTTAGSMEKARMAHVLVTLNRINQDEEFDINMVYFVAKNRSGMSQMKVGPIPTQWEIGRMAPVSREEPW